MGGPSTSRHEERETLFSRNLTNNPHIWGEIRHERFRRGGSSGRRSVPKRRDLLDECSDAVLATPSGQTQGACLFSTRSDPSNPAPSIGERRVNGRLGLAAFGALMIGAAPVTAQT